VKFRRFQSSSFPIEPSEWLDRVAPFLPARFRETLKLRTFGLFKIPLLFLISPTVLEINDEKVEVLVPLNRRTRNHLHSMYFAVLAAGADCACGALAFYWIKKRAKGRINLIFKDFKADFLKRAEGDVIFSCVQGSQIQEAVERVIQTQERQNLPVDVLATVSTPQGPELVARFVLTLSLKCR
jgi:acyl-coenzyme A thioesterase PaaI-like protein